ncbi:MAG: hypothetical protein V8Q30_10420 [Acutalibacteraceae bacterium]
MSRLITEVYDLTGFEAVARAMENGRQRLQNLRLLPEYAAAYEERGYAGLSAFLRLIDRLVPRPGRTWTRAPWCPPGKIPSPS